MLRTGEPGTIRASRRSRFPNRISANSSVLERDDRYPPAPRRVWSFRALRAPGTTAVSGKRTFWSGEILCPRSRTLRHLTRLPQNTSDRDAKSRCLENSRILRDRWSPLLILADCQRRHAYGKTCTVSRHPRGRDSPNTRWASPLLSAPLTGRPSERRFSSIQIEIDRVHFA
jgi:hypothetical protein